jgi:hypothetical protein
MITPKDAINCYKDNRPKRLKETIAKIDSSIAQQAKTSSTCYSYGDCASDLIRDVIKHYTKLGWFVKYKDGDWGDYLLFYGDNKISWWKKFWL